MDKACRNVFTHACFEYVRASILFTRARFEVHTCLCIGVDACIHMCNTEIRHACVHVCMCTCTLVCVYIHAYVYVCIHVHSYARVYDSVTAIVHVHRLALTVWECGLYMRV